MGGCKEARVSDRAFIFVGFEDFRAECQETVALGHCDLGSWVHPDSGLHVLFDLYLWVCLQGPGGLICHGWALHCHKYVRAELNEV